MSAIFGWARPDNLQPEPITVKIWRELPEDFCRRVEIVNGEAVRAESPMRAHQTAARRLTNLLEASARRHVRLHQDGCLEANLDFDVVLWEFPRATIRRPDAALFDCAPEELRPLPASLVKLIVEVVSPGTEKVDIADKKAEYALAGIPWYWIVWIDDNRVTRIETYVLDHVFGQYKPHRELEHGDPAIFDMPIRIKIDWDELDQLIP